MIRILHTSDLHIDERGRLADVELVLEEIVETARRHEVDLIVVAGDHFERKSTPTERNALARFFQAACEVAPVVSVRGNHDQPGDLDIFRKLKTRFPLHIFDRADGPVFIELRPREEFGLAVLALPWVEKAHIAAQLPVNEAARATGDTVTALKGLLDSLRAEATDARANGFAPILVTHVMLGGSVVSTGQILIGQGVELSPSDLLGVGCEYVACGHIHKQQVWFGGRVAYSGSPHRCNFGETESKGCCLVTIHGDGTFVSNEFIPLPSRRMVLLEGRIDGPVDPNTLFLSARGSWGAGVKNLNGALVRLRYHVRAGDLHLVNTEAIEAALHAEGAEEIQLEAIVESETRARAPEIVEARTTQAKVDAYLAAKGIQTDEAQHGRLVEKLGELEMADAAS